MPEGPVALSPSEDERMVDGQPAAPAALSSRDEETEVSLTWRHYYKHGATPMALLRSLQGPEARVAVEWHFWHISWGDKGRQSAGGRESTGGGRAAVRVGFLLSRAGSILHPLDVAVLNLEN